MAQSEKTIGCPMCDRVFMSMHGMLCHARYHEDKQRIEMLAALNGQNQENTLPQEVTLDLIQDLRFRGMHDEARKLLEEWRACKERVKNDIRRENKKIKAKIYQHKLKVASKNI